MTVHSRLRIVLFREGRFWIAQGLEHDIGVQAEDLKDVMVRLALALELAEPTLLGLPPAPAYFQDLWKHRAGSFEPLSPGTAVPVQFAIVA